MSKILGEVAKSLYERFSPEDRAKCELKHVEQKLAECVNLLFKEECVATGKELLVRCLQPGRREFVQIKQAVRKAFTERQGEPVAINYVRSNVNLFMTAIMEVPTKFQDRQILNELVEAKILPPPADKPKE